MGMFDKAVMFFQCLMLMLNVALNTAEGMVAISCLASTGWGRELRGGLTRLIKAGERSARVGSLELGCRDPAGVSGRCWCRDRSVDRCHKVIDGGASAGADAGDPRAPYISERFHRRDGN